jgi:hypothetical protein
MSYNGILSHEVVKNHIAYPTSARTTQRARDQHLYMRLEGRLQASGWNLK